MASIIKAVMGMQRGVIPAHLHFRDPNPGFDWAKMPVQITSERMAWPALPGRPARAAVNSFGLSGTNAHVVLEGYPAPANDPFGGKGRIRPAGPPRPVAVPPTGGVGDPAVSDEPPARRTKRLLTLSAKSRGSLRELAKSYLAWLDETGADVSAPPAGDRLLADMAWTASMGRSHFPHRAGLVFGEAGELQAALEALVDSPGETDPVRIRFLVQTGRPQTSIRLCRPRPPMGRYGKVPLSDRAGGARGTGPLRPTGPGRAGNFPAGCDRWASRLRSRLVGTWVGATGASMPWRQH